MKKLLILALLVGAGYGLYQYLTTLTPLATAPATQLASGKQAEEVAKNKMSQATVQSVQNAVNGFRDQNGRYPTSLQELVDKGMIESVPAGVTYDPATGKVSAG